MSRLGQSFTVDASLLAACETFTCRLYGFPDSTEINAVRYKLLCANATTPERLPPSQNALKQHVHRANYQAAVWRGALRNDLVQPTPVGNGWVQSSDGMLQIQWMTQEATPKDIRDLITCGCKTGCMSNRRCKCRKNGLPCADVCKCTLTACTNRPVPVQQTQATSISATALTAVTVEEESDESDSDGRDGSTDSNDTADTISAEDFSSNELEH
ncbi:uncharacterized protein LOC135820064 [Sycon ciliatum]|uniref:uncharacterized protein LOC135820064 n=1 Tax=Sycon ciliatum TaxID=27933 RepID=UPI0031F60FF2